MQLLFSKQFPYTIKCEDSVPMYFTHTGNLFTCVCINMCPERGFSFISLTEELSVWEMNNAEQH